MFIIEYNSESCNKKFENHLFCQQTINVDFPKFACDYKINATSKKLYYKKYKSSYAIHKQLHDLSASKRIIYY